MRASFLLVLAGCASSDPCVGSADTCVTLNVGGSAVVDRLIVMLSGATEGAQQTSQSGTVELPQLVGLDLVGVTDGTLHVQVVAENNGALVGRATGSLPIVNGQHAHLTVQLAPAAQGFDGGLVQARADAGAPDAGATAATCAALDGLVAYFPLDDDSLDHSGAGYALVDANVRRAVGKLGNGLLFNGQDSLARVVGTPLGLGDRTLCAWIESAPRTSAGEPLFSGGQGDVGELYGVQPSLPQGTDCPMPGELFSDPGTGCVAAGLATPVAVFRLVCFVESASTRQSAFFDNGTLSVLAAPSTAFDVTTLTVGAKADTSAGAAAVAPAYSGVIDEVSIWNRALSHDELDVLWQLGAGCRVR